MTYAAVPRLRADPRLAAEWTPRLASTAYDSGTAPGRQGRLPRRDGDDREAGRHRTSGPTSPTATHSGRDGEYLLNGHKWFTSAPMNDVFLVLAQAPEASPASSCRGSLPDGTRNPFAIQRLKDKLGNRSNASAEIEFHDTWATRLGRRGPRRPHHHRDGRRDPARLRTRVGRADAEGRRRGRLARVVIVGLRRAADRQAR